MITDAQLTSLRKANQHLLDIIVDQTSTRDKGLTIPQLQFLNSLRRLLTQISLRAD